jgi:hypothetical protein
MWRAEGPVHPSPVASIFVRPIGKGSPIQRALHAKGDFVQDGRTPERIGAAGVALRLLRGREGTPPLVQAAERFAAQIAVAVEIVFGHHPPYLQRPEEFADQLRPILRELVRWPSSGSTGSTYDEDRGDGAPIVLIHGRRRRTSVSRVRENRMPGSMRRREESGTSRARTCRTALAPPADPTATGWHRRRLARLAEAGAGRGRVDYRIR